MSAERKERPSEAEAIEARAAAWLAQRDDGLTETQEREFAAWREADPRHAAAVTRLQAAWALLQGLRDCAGDAPLAAGVGRVAAFPRWRWTTLALGAAAAIALVGAWVAHSWRAGPAAAPTALAAPQVFVTTVGGYGRETLVDGSVVELNASTELQVSYTPAERRVRLLRGEAHFTVAKNKHRPFWVEAGGVAVRAVGTAFNVRLAARQVDVLVTEGRVRVNHTTSAGGRIATVAEAPELGAGERASISTTPDSPVAIEKVSAEAMREALAWRYGPRLDFSGTPLAEVVQQFNRHNRIQLELGDPALGDEPVGGSFQAENVEAFVQLLTSERDIVADRPSADRIVLRKAR